jgi:hypothetical protein
MPGLISTSIGRSNNGSNFGEAQRMVAQTQLVEFLEKYPLYRKLHGCFRDYSIKIADFNDEEIRLIAEIRVELHCPICRKNRTYAALEPKQLRRDDSDIDPDCWTDPYVERALYSISYRCSHCNVSHVDFILFLDYVNQNLQKVGQNPPWSIAVGKAVERFLGADADLLKRGKICESQGYGIAAFAYYRRVIENIISSLLTELADLIPEAERREYSHSLTIVQGNQNASDKIRLVKDLLPSSLQPNGSNPLGILYAAMSQGLHQESDEACLESAAQIYACLTYLIQAVSAHDAAAKEFSDNIKRLLDKAANTATPRAPSNGKGT